ncbi:MAG: hypothetical protein K8M05_10295, partial [Deltaproteobacteria bacterium]|nr:hypothetical protein [Kofleriaceae bacterium]
ETPDAGAPLLEAPPPGSGRQLAMDVAIAPGQETEQCQYVVVDERVDIARFEHAYTRGSHHLLLYQTGFAPSEVSLERFDCTGAQFTELGVAGIAYAAQVPNGDLAYPTDVALRAEAGAVLLVQTHYLNASAEPLDAQVRLNLWYAPAPAPVLAGTLFFYDWAIHVPAGEPVTAHMRCNIPADVNLVFGMSHMHRRGVGYRAVLEDASANAAPTELFATTDWEGVEPRRYAPELAVAAGSVIDYRCDFQGEAGRDIVEGPSAEANEMCMFVASYYPRLDTPTELCAGPGSGPVFTGTQACGDTVTCVREAGDDAIATEACLVDTCAASSAPAVELMKCINFQCAAPCAQGEAACDTCALNTCGDQLSACYSAGC